MRSLLDERAMSLGGARRLVDVLCFALLHNASSPARRCCLS